MVCNSAMKMTWMILFFCLAMLPSVLSLRSMPGDCYTVCAPPPASVTPSPEPAAPAAPSESPSLPSPAAPAAPSESPSLPSPAAVPFQPVTPVAAADHPRWPRIRAILVIIGVSISAAVIAFFLPNLYHSPFEKALQDVLSSTVIAIVKTEEESRAIEMIGEMNLDSAHELHLPLVMLDGLMLESLDDPKKAARIICLLSANRSNSHVTNGIEIAFNRFQEKLSKGEFDAYSESVQHAAVYFGALVHDGLLLPRDMPPLNLSSATTQPYASFLQRFFQEIESISEERYNTWLTRLFTGDTEADFVVWRRFVANVATNNEFWSQRLREAIERLTRRGTDYSVRRMNLPPPKNCVSSVELDQQGSLSPPKNCVSVVELSDQQGRLSPPKVRLNLPPPKNCGSSGVELSDQQGWLSPPEVKRMNLSPPKNCGSGMELSDQQGKLSPPKVRLNLPPPKNCGSSGVELSDQQGWLSPPEVKRMNLSPPKNGGSGMELSDQQGKLSPPKVKRMNLSPPKNCGSGMELSDQQGKLSPPKFRRMNLPPPKNCGSGVEHSDQQGRLSLPKLASHDMKGMRVIPPANLTPDEAQIHTSNISENMDDNDPANQKYWDQITQETLSKSFKDDEVIPEGDEEEKPPK